MEGFELIGQGAEARLYKGIYLGRDALVKERFVKRYRHPHLDARLTKERTRAEARAMVRAKAVGITTPALFLVDLERRSIFMEYVENTQTLKSYIDERAASTAPSSEGNESAEMREWIDRLAHGVARIVFKLHSKNIVHGDLTTSNVLIRRGNSEREEATATEASLPLVLVDFGLSRVESTTEDQAVDLYVLERSLLGSHPTFARLFDAVLTNYIASFTDAKQRREISAKYEEVRARGRKRCVVG